MRQRLRRSCTSPWGPLSIVALLSLVSIVATPAVALPDGPGPVGVPVRPRISTAFFTENVGQVTNADVRFYRSGDSLGIGFVRDGLILNVWGPAHHETRSPPGSLKANFTVPFRTGTSVFVRFEGANGVDPSGRGALPFMSNFYLGKDPGHWFRQVPSYRDVAYENLYDGIDLTFHPNDEGIKYELLLHPGAELGRIRFTYLGVDSLLFDADGSLAAPTPWGELRDDAPVAVQDGAPRACWYTRLGPRSHGFGCDVWDASRPLAVDPLLYSTLLGGTGGDAAYSVTVDDAGSAYVAGKTVSIDFPTTPGAFDGTHNGGEDGFLAKLNSSGSSLVFATYFGGNGLDEASDAAWDSDRGVYVTGQTNSSDFPVTTGVVDESFNGGGDCSISFVCGDAFVLGVDAYAGLLRFSTFLGGSDGDFGGAVAAGGAHFAYVAGITRSIDFPATMGAYDTTPNGEIDTFVAKLASDGRTLAYATLLGGSGDDEVFDMALDPAEDAYVTGDTYSVNFPVTPGAFDTTLGGVGDAFVTKIDPRGQALLYSTLIGSDRYNDQGLAIAVDTNGSATITGDASDGYPTTPGVFDSTAGPSVKAFVTKFAPAGDSLLFSTFLGGTAGQDGLAIALDAQGNSYVTGFTYAPDFPVTEDAVQLTYGGNYDAFLAKVNRRGSALVYSTYLGGGNWDAGYDLAVDSVGDVFLAGETSSPTFPTTAGAFQEAMRGPGEAFVLKLGTPPAVNTPPILTWTGEAGYVSSGVGPRGGIRSTIFSYRVAYRDAENDPPSALLVHIDKPLGVRRAAVPLTMDRWAGEPGNYTAGAVFAVETTLPTLGTDYWYAFNVSDGITWGVGTPTIPTNAPEVRNVPPVSRLAGEPLSGSTSVLFTLNGSASTDSDGSISSYSFDFGDGAGASGLDSTATHTYASAGTYTVTLVVTDNDGASNSTSVMIRVDAPPSTTNWKPLVAAVFAAILALVGATSAKRAPWPTGSSPRLRAFVLAALPFVAGEAATGVVSLLTGHLAIPPVSGAGMAVDSVILVTGISVSLHRVRTRRL